MLIKIRRQAREIVSAVFVFAGEYASFGFAMRFLAIGECKQKYSRNGNVRLQTRYSCCSRSVINGFVMRFVAIEECKQIYGRSGNIRFRTIYSCCCRSTVNGFVMRFVRAYKNGRCGEIPPCRKYDILQFRFIYQSVADWLCVIVSASSDLRKAVFFIQLFCRFVITADLKKNAFYAVIFAFIYKIFH